MSVVRPRTAVTTGAAAVALVVLAPTAAMATCPDQGGRHGSEGSQRQASHDRSEGSKGAQYSNAGYRTNSGGEGEHSKSSSSEKDRSSQKYSSDKDESSRKSSSKG